MNNDDFPILVPEDNGFAIYVNNEKVDWYENEADAEGVALSMMDKELNDESFFERSIDDDIPFNESRAYWNNFFDRLTESASKTNQ